MKEFYLISKIPVEWPEKIKEEAVDGMKKKLPDNANIRYEGYMAMGQHDFVIIYTAGAGNQMTDDIVNRLRQQVCECGYAASFNELHKCLWCEASDEIERLGELLFQEIYHGQEKLDEIERLRAIIQDIANAVTDEGRKPGYHKQQVNYVRTMWNPLWQAISKAVKEANNER